MADKAPPSMRADDVRRDMRDQNRKREAVYDTVLGFIHKSILKKADVGGLRLYYEIPFIVVGKPVIKVDDCVRYILSSLQSDGYTVRFKFPKSVYVSWDCEEKRRYPKLSASEINDISDRVKQVVYCSKTAANTGVRPQGPETSRDNHGNPIGGNPIAVPNHAPTQSIPHTNRGVLTQANATANQQATNLYAQQGHANPYQPNASSARAPVRARAMLPWEAFESTQPLRNQPLSLLPPPQITVTHMCEIPRDPAAPIPNFAPTPNFGMQRVSHTESEPFPKEKNKPSFGQRDATMSVEKIGPNGGLVLNL